MNGGPRGQALSHLAGTLQRQPRGRQSATPGPGRAVVQRVGGQTTGYDPSKIGKKQFADDVRDLFAVARRVNRLRKALATSANLKKLDTLAKEARGPQVKGAYAESLVAISLDTAWLNAVLTDPGRIDGILQSARDAGLIDDPGVAEVKATTGRIAPRLTVSGSDILDASWKNTDPGAQPKVPILSGDAAFAEVAKADPTKGVYRDTYKKLGKEGDQEYVKDDLGVHTRRTAYMEKSYHQVMAYQETGVLTGKTQELMSAATGAAPSTINPLAFGSQHLTGDERAVIDKQGALKATATTDDKMNALAYMHQWKGSGPGQRGLSLTSTPKDDGVFGNAGESFRSPDGAKFEIDLARVNPADNILINHYSGASKTRAALEGSADTSDRKLTGAGRVKPGKGYQYERSVIKNRELYLQKVTPNEVTRVTPHGVGANIARDSAIFLSEKQGTSAQSPTVRAAALELRVQQLSAQLLAAQQGQAQANASWMGANQQYQLASSHVFNLSMMHPATMLAPGQTAGMMLIAWANEQTAWAQDMRWFSQEIQRHAGTIGNLQLQIAGLRGEITKLRSTHAEKGWQTRASYEEGYRDGMAAKNLGKGGSDAANIKEIVGGAYGDHDKHTPYWQGYGAALRS